MRRSLASQNLLVLLSILSLTNPSSTTTTDPPVNTTTAAQPWTAPAIFYPFGSAAGDTEHFENGGESYYSVGFSTPFKFFARTYNQIYVNYNGLLTFNVPAVSGLYNPTRGTEDFIAGLWNDFDDNYSGVFSYQQYTNGSILTRATQDVNQYFSSVNFNASWVFVVTWMYGPQLNPAILFQVILVSGGGQSYFLMNYGNCAVLYGQVEAGYDTKNSISQFVIPDATNGNYQNLNNTSNVNVTGRWAFNAWAAPAIFYPFGSAAGDTEYSLTSDEGYVSAPFSTSYTFFGNTYNSAYVHFNGLLTFNQPQPASGPNYVPTRGAEDFIAPLWSDLDDYYSGLLSYQQYTNGSVLIRATRDINQHFPQKNFNASWVFVVTWKYGPQQNPAILFQVALISDGSLSFFLVNYGDCAVISEQMEAGYDTINSISHFVIPDSTNGNYQNLKNTTNVNVPGRWAFIANNASGTTTTTTTGPSVSTTTGAQPWTAPTIFYPFGSAAGDTEHFENGGESYYSVGFSTPFKFFGRTYNQIYVNYNGLLTFNVPSMSGPYNPTRGTEDFIAGLWNDFDDYYSGLISYQQYTNGSILTRATQDVNQYFSSGNFGATWVFVVTWKYGPQLNPAILFQVILVSGGGQSYFLMNYGNCAVLYGQVEAGYDTINSISQFVIPDSTNGNYQNLKNTSNVNVPGRWAFNAWAAPAIFYPFGSVAGDTEYSLISDEGYVSAPFSTSYTFFGNTYNSAYVHLNGLLTFNQPQPASEPNYYPIRGTEDVITPLWGDLDDYYSGLFSYKQYTNGSVLTRATRDINQHFPQKSSTASWVFVVTWKYGPQQNPAILFQVVLISDGNLSFFLINYGDCAVIYGNVEAGYDTINSINHFVIPGSNNGYTLPLLKNSSNVNVPGRWAFMAGSENVLGLQVRLQSFSDLTQQENIEAVLQQIKQELVSRGLSRSVNMKLRKVKKTQ